MGKLIKYNFKSYYKEIIILLSLIVLANIGLFLKVNKWERISIMVISIVIASFASLVTLIWNINMFSKDLYSDSSYLIFTLPITGKQILGAKLITATIQMILVNIVGSIFTYIHLNSLPKGFEMFTQFLNGRNILIGLIITIFQYISFLLTVYVSISLSRVAIRKRNLGKLGTFGIFIVINIIFVKAIDLVQQIFSKTMNISIKSSIFPSASSIDLGGFTINIPNIHVNIASTIFSILVAIGLFMVTSYLLQEKVEI